jgi:enoyl-CoA hydratase/carnithine racemase
VLTLHRPERLNALTTTMFGELVAACGALRADAVRAVVLTGAGSAFCAGYDLEEAESLGTASAAQLLELQDAACAALQAVYSLPAPVIAAVRGPAVGGGFCLSLAADLRLAGASARFQPVFVRLGLSGGDMGASWLLPRLIGAGLAAELLYTGRAVRAEEAARVGLANRVLADADLLQEAVALAATIAAHEPLGVRLTKRSLRANAEAPSLAAALELESRAQVLLLPRMRPSGH